MTRFIRPQSRGFTLLELLVALAVTAAVVTLMFAGFGVIGRTEERNQRLIDRTEHMLVVSQWLGRKFDTLRLLSRNDSGAFVNFFSGTAAGAIWVAPLPERGEAGGLYVFRITPLRHENGRIDLSVEALPYDGVLTALDWNRALRETLLKDVRTLQWYYAPRSGYSNGMLPKRSIPPVSRLRSPMSAVTGPPWFLRWRGHDENATPTPGSGADTGALAGGRAVTGRIGQCPWDSPANPAYGAEP